MNESELQYLPVCGETEIEEGGSKMFVIGDIRIGLYRLGGEIFALDNDCPHAGASLAHGEVCDGVVRCRIHHWGFDIKTGTYVDQDMPQFNVKTRAIRVVDGTIEVQV